MKKNSKYSLMTVMFIVLLSFASCIKDDDATVLLPLPIGDIQGVKVPEGMVAHLNVNEGTTPPEIKGRYVADSMTIDFASDGYWNDDFHTLYLTFTSVVGRHTTTYEERQGSASATTSYSRVIGSGNDFTVYFLSDMSDATENWSCQMLTIISGTVTDVGIENFQYSNAMIEKQDPYHKIMEVGEYHVFDNRGETVRRVES